MSLLVVIGFRGVNAMHRPPLAEAANRGDLLRVRQLIADGANINEQGGFLGDTALHCAARCGDANIAQELIAAKANVSTYQISMA